MSEADRDYRPAAYVIILLGMAAAAVASMVPQYAIGYRLEVGVLFAMLTPYLVYGALTERLRGPALLLPGLILLAVSLTLVATQRFQSYDGYANGVIYWLPLVVTVVVLPLAYWFQGQECRSGRQARSDATQGTG